MTTEFKRMDSTQRSLLVSSKRMFEIIGKELGKEKEFKEYRRLFNEATDKAALVQDFPIHIEVELNFLCNYRCPFCVISLPEEERKEWGDPTKKLSFDTYKKIIDEGVQHGLKSVQFNGNNEPLTERQLPKFIKYAVDKGILDISFNTNGSLLDKKISEELIDAGVTRLMVSVDAFKKETYEKYRVGGNYETVKNNILNFLKIRNKKGKVLPLVRISYIVHSNNIDELPDFIDYWKDKVDFFALQSLRDVFTFDKKRSKELRKLFKIDESKIDKFYVCPQPFFRAFIRNNGDVLPCCSAYAMKMVIGNIYEDTLYNIWNGEKMKEVRRRVNDIKNQPFVCKKCREGATKNYDLNEFSERLCL